MTAIDTHELARRIGPVLKRLYPQNPDVVIGREARAIAEAIAPLLGEATGTGTSPEASGEG